MIRSPYASWILYFEDLGTEGNLCLLSKCNGARLIEFNTFMFVLTISRSFTQNFLWYRKQCDDDIYYVF